MDTIRSMLQEITYSLPTIKFMDILDILVVAFIIYQVISLIRSSSAARVARGILVLVLVTWLTGVVHMYTMSFILNKILELGIIAVVIVFQPELRRVLERVGSGSIPEVLGVKDNRSETETVIGSVVNACELMAKEHTGALIVFERNTMLTDYFKTGTVLDARVTASLIRNLFFSRAVLHDGAIIIRNGRIAAAACVLPLSQNTRLSADLGTRHRAGLGMSEVSDAVVVVVSEETGSISVAVGGMLKRHLAPKTLELLLLSEMIHEQERSAVSMVERIEQFFKKKDDKHAKK